jgi:ABC-type transporter Mla subunit MlaD
VERLEVLLSDKNLDAVSSTLENVKSASGDLPGITREASALAAQLRATSSEVNDFARQLHGVADKAGPQIEASLVDVRATAAKLSRTADSLDRIVVGNEPALAQFAGSGVSEIQALIVDLRGASDEVRALARGLRDQPSSLVIEQKEGGMEIPP